MFLACSALGIFLYWTRKSLNNLLSYCGLISTSEKDLPIASTRYVLEKVLENCLVWRKPEYHTHKVSTILNCLPNMLVGLFDLSRTMRPKPFWSRTWIFISSQFFLAAIPNLMWLACQKKSYLICDEITNFRIFTQPIPNFFWSTKLRLPNRADSCLKKINIT